MAMTISTLNPSFKPSLNPFKPYKFTSSSPPRITLQSFNSRNCNHASPVVLLSSKKLGFCWGSRNKNLGFALKAQNVEAQGQGGETGLSKAEMEAFGGSSLPKRFKSTRGFAPSIWPYLLALSILIYAWRAVIWELGTWRKVAALAIQRAFSYVADPAAFLMLCFETALYTIRAFYSGIVAYAPIADLTLIIVLSSLVLAIAETAVPNSINSQPYLLTVAGLAGYAAVRGFISEPILWTLLLGLVVFSRFVKKRDNVSSTLPLAGVIAAIGEPWVRFVVMASYLALAIIHHSNKTSKEKELEGPTKGSRVPFPLLCAGLAIGLRVAVKWAGYRHLTWMIV